MSSTRPGSTLHSSRSCLACGSRCLERCMLCGVARLRKATTKCSEQISKKSGPGMWIHPICCKYRSRAGRLPVSKTEIMASRNGQDRPATKDSQKSLKKTIALDNDSTLQSRYSLQIRAPAPMNGQRTIGVCVASVISGRKGVAGVE
ncbi:Hypothetical predicted protein [Olea europaea subsp. europaea]|uniref:Uncharacterized protein n=1 Tax=Olea europaea subsp. europaea TaxID=158383 RepID=A0A8S0VPK2_OLEEU|nr:Hypothetical predicted protein [Olea europaea subsp. europaea]